jgi:hypothetical protein
VVVAVPTWSRPITPTACTTATYTPSTRASTTEHGDDGGHEVVQHDGNVEYVHDGHYDER